MACGYLLLLHASFPMVILHCSVTVVLLILSLAEKMLDLVTQAFLLLLGTTVAAVLFLVNISLTTALIDKLT